MAEEVITPESLKAELKAEFGAVVLAVPDRQDFSFYAVINRVYENEGTPTILLFPSIEKNFVIEVTGIDKTEDQWLVHSPQQTWAFRKVTKEDGAQFLQQMNRAGVNSIA